MGSSARTRKTPSKDFQESKHLAKDGIVGPTTWGALLADPLTPLLQSERTYQGQAGVPWTGSSVISRGGCLPEKPAPRSRHSPMPRRSDAAAAGRRSNGVGPGDRQLRSRAAALSAGPGPTHVTRPPPVRTSRPMSLPPTPTRAHP